MGISNLRVSSWLANFPFSGSPVTESIHQSQQFIEPLICECSLRDILVEGRKAVATNFPIRIRPDRRQLAGISDRFRKRKSGIARGNPSRRRAGLGRKSISNSMNQEFEQRGAIQAISEFRPLNEVRRPRTLHRSVDLGRIEAEFVRQAQVRRPFAVLQRKLKHDDDIEWPEHDQIIQYSNKLNIERLGNPGPLPTPKWV